MRKLNIGGGAESERKSAGQRQRWRWLVWMAAAMVLAGGVLTLAQGGKSPSGKVNEAAAARGKYIVEGVARCTQCHTPLDSEGNPDRAQWLQGAPIRWVPAAPDSNWPLQAPRIGGVPLPASDEDMAKLLMTGVWTTGDHLRAPMPQFRMDREDAEAVVAYLKSLSQQR